MIMNNLKLLSLLILINSVIVGQQPAKRTPLSVQRDAMPTVTLNELLRNSGRYKNKIVRIRALYGSWFEGSEFSQEDSDHAEGSVWVNFPDSVQSKSNPDVAERLEDIFFRVIQDEKGNPIGFYDLWQTEILVTGKIYKSKKKAFGIHGGYTYLFEVASIEEIGTPYRYDWQSGRKIPYTSESSAERRIRHTQEAIRVCELNSLALDKMLTELQSPDEKITLVAMLGRGEQSRELNRRRLAAIRDYLTQCAGVDSRRVIIREGEQSRFEGRVNVYRGNELSKILLAAPDQNICLKGCAAPPNNSFNPTPR